MPEKNNLFIANKFLSVLKLPQDDMKKFDIAGKYFSLFLFHYFLNGSAEQSYDFLRKLSYEEIERENFANLLTPDYVEWNYQRLLDMSAQELIDELHEVYLRLTSYLYHGFTSCNFESIYTHGLNPNVKENDELYIKMCEFQQKYPKLFNDALIFNEDKNVIYYSTTPVNTLSYAIHAPEWFERFTDGGLSTKNYQKAKNNVLERIAEADLTSSQSEEVMSFFDSAWKKYANSKPMFVIFKNFNNRMNKEEFFENYKILLDATELEKKDTKEKLNDLFSAVIDASISMEFFGCNINAKTDKVIPPENLTFYALPDIAYLNWAYENNKRW